MKNLNIENLIKSAIDFCKLQNKVNHIELIGVTDGKKVGTYVEQLFKNYLLSQYQVNIGNSATGLDLPDTNINTDIKVTSLSKPQSSCPYKSASQKIYGLGYNLLIFVYEKCDTSNSCFLNFVNCTFVDKTRTADYTTTKHLIEMLKEQANEEDIYAYLSDRNLPGDEIILNSLAEKIIMDPPKQGYLTISNALQWRLRYRRVISLNNIVEGVINYDL